MLLFGHMGLGRLMAQPWIKKIAPLWLLFGTLLPDLIDKPLYYGQVLATGKRGYELGLFSGTRSIGHSMLFFLFLYLLAAYSKNKNIICLAIGVATHLILDNIPELFNEFDQYSSRIALFFPFYGWRFPVSGHNSMGEHFYSHLKPYDLLGEILGLCVLIYWYFSSKKRSA